MVSAIISELAQHVSTWPLIVKAIAAISLVCLTAISLLLTYTMLLRIRQDAEQRHFEHFKARWRPVLFDWLAGRDTALPPLRRRDRYRMLELWHDARRQLDDESAEGLNRFAERIQLDRIAASALQYRRFNAQNRNVWLQVLAIRAARLMNTTLARQVLVSASESPNFLINVEATCALVELGHPDAEYSVLATLLQFNRWVPYIANRVSRAGGSEILHLLLKQIDLLGNEQSRNLFSLLEYTDDRDLVPLLVDQLYKVDDAEIQALILRTLGRIGDAGVKRHLLPFLNSPHAWLRLHAIVALGRIGQPGDLERLTPLLSDPDWWVRYRTAQTCVKLLGNDASAIARLAAGIRDDYAREALAQVQAEQSL